METIVVPTLNEKENIRATILEILANTKKEATEIIVVDNGSTDGTPEEICDLPVKVVYCQRVGKGYALKKGVEQAQGELVVIIDGDHTYDGKVIPTIIHTLKNTEHRLVSTNRFVQKESSFYPLRYWGNKLISFLGGKLLKSNRKDILSGLYGLSKKDFLDLNLESNGFDIEAEIAIKSLREKWMTTEIPVIYRGRRHSNLRPLKDGWKIIKTIMAAS
ncbi:MAG: glycosyltransferase family 2 protein [Anaplasmataceae bacterium]|nr:glycosyltransferase family 2 protein [Anaplasmataceae bacterium]